MKDDICWIQFIVVIDEVDHRGFVNIFLRRVKSQFHEFVLNILIIKIELSLFWLKKSSKGKEAEHMPKAEGSSNVFYSKRVGSAGRSLDHFDLWFSHPQRD